MNTFIIAEKEGANEDFVCTVHYNAALNKLSLAFFSSLQLQRFKFLWGQNNAQKKEAPPRDCCKKHACMSVSYAKTFPTNRRQIVFLLSRSFSTFRTLVDPRREESRLERRRRKAFFSSLSGASCRIEKSLLLLCGLRKASNERERPWNLYTAVVGRSKTRKRLAWNFSQGRRGELFGDATWLYM